MGYLVLYFIGGFVAGFVCGIVIVIDFFPRTPEPDEQDWKLKGEK
jgi:hypothetical protein